MRHALQFDVVRHVTQFNIIIIIIIFYELCSSVIVVRHVPLVKFLF